ncbi:MAG: dihydrodipicolinate synthase family protein, partial [Pseudomonadota bacterium]|nr:dihydrodipicolinate synthase family protein [Pseudomonadota bacterium]
MIKGLIAPILSPFNDDLSFNQGLYDDLAAELLETGCAGLAPFGTTGEALSVSCAERMAALEGLVASGVDPKVIIPGTGLCNLPESIALSRHAVELGCAGVMTLPPF